MVHSGQAESASIYQQARAVEQQIGRVIAAIDSDSLAKAERELVMQLKHQTIDGRLSVRDYEYAESRAEQLRLADEARGLLEQLHATMLTASEYNIFSAVDIAELSAAIQHIIGQLD